MQKKREKQKHHERLIKHKIIRDIGTLFQQEEENYYKPKRASRFWNNSYIEYEGNSDKNNKLPLDACLNKIKTSLRNIIIDLQSSDTWKIQLTFAINFISSKDTAKECVMHSTNGNIKYAPYNKVVNELFELLCSKCQDNLETSMRGSEFIFDSVQLRYYKRHEVNFKRDGSCIDSWTG